MNFLVFNEEAAQKFIKEHSNYVVLGANYFKEA